VPRYKFLSIDFLCFQLAWPTARSPEQACSEGKPPMLFLPIIRVYWQILIFVKGPNFLRKIAPLYRDFELNSIIIPFLLKLEFNGTRLLIARTPCR
jgi:hypothetical protein